MGQNISRGLPKKSRGLYDLRSSFLGLQTFSKNIVSSLKTKLISAPTTFTRTITITEGLGCIENELGQEKEDQLCTWLYQDSCYNFVTNFKKDFFAAERYCATEFNGSLAAITSFEEDDF